jgi:hypothetical protein
MKPFMFVVLSITSSLSMANKPFGDGCLPFKPHPAGVRDADTLNDERHTGPPS